MVQIYHAGLKFTLEAKDTGMQGQGHKLVKLLEETDSERGANALNTSSLRYHLQSEESIAVNQDEIEVLIESSLQASCDRMRAEISTNGAKKVNMPPLRWELGACWVQRLTEQKEEQAAQQSIGRASNDKKKQQVADDLPVNLNEVGEGLEEALGPKAVEKLVKSDIGVHKNSKKEMLSAAVNYYDNASLARVVDDFSSLELSPVDGRTLTDFMHTRGLNMRSLGKVAQSAGKLEHVKVKPFRRICRFPMRVWQSLCQFCKLISNRVIGRHCA